MAKFETESVVTQSVLERLIDREPDAKQEPAPTRSQSVRLLKVSVRRDLEWLLNTRQNPEAVSDEYPEVAKSLFNYGLPDFSSIEFRQSQRSGEASEALWRIRSASSNPGSNRLVWCPCRRDGSLSNRTIRFQIEGLLKMDPAPEQVTFDTVLQLSSGEYQIRGDRGGA